MKCKISYIIRLNTIDDSILKKLQSYFIELKVLPEYCDLIQNKYDPIFYNEDIDNNLINSNDQSTNFFDYNSTEHKKILSFFYNNKLIINYNIIINNYAVIDYDKNDYNSCEYFNLYLNFYQSSISKKCIDANTQKFMPTILTENFIMFDNHENLVCNKNIVNKIQFQEYNTGFCTIYFINKSLGDFLLNNSFTGFKLLPVKNTNNS